MNLEPATEANMIGRVFGRLTVASFNDRGKSGDSRWNCRCACGKKSITTAYALRHGITISCGCARIKSTMEERFWKFVYKTWNCWFWLGSTTNKGYGELNIGGVAELTHQISYRIHFGDYAPGLWILHKCDTPPCVNPAHLYAGTAAQNIQDKIMAGNASALSLKTHCKRGHPLSGENMRLYGPTNTYRCCRACMNIYYRARRARALLAQNPTIA
jgi:hypothetical protein